MLAISVDERKRKTAVAAGKTARPLICNCLRQIKAKSIGIKEEHSSLHKRLHAYSPNHDPSCMTSFCFATTVSLIALLVLISRDRVGLADGTVLFVFRPCSCYELIKFIVRCRETIMNCHCINNGQMPSKAYWSSSLLMAISCTTARRPM